MNIVDSCTLGLLDEHGIEKVYCIMLLAREMQTIDTFL